MDMSNRLPNIRYEPVSSKSEHSEAQKAHHPTAAKVAKVAFVVFTAITVVGVLGLLGVATFGIIPVAALGVMVGVGGIGAALSYLKNYWASRTKEDMTFEEYVKKMCVPTTVNRANELAQEGEQILANIRKDQEQAFPGNMTNEERKKHIQEKLVPVMWFFVKCAFDTNQGFEKGMMKFEDKDHKIAGYFAPLMYERASSHFQDERETSLGADAEGLPFIFQHVHMGKLQANPDAAKQFSFCKLEQFGLKGEVIQHGLDFCRTGLARWMGEYDGPNERKEKQIPKPIQKAFKDLCREVNQSPAQKCKTIAEMYNWAQALPNEQGKTFIQELDKYFLQTKDHHAHRKGNEVILNFSE